MPRVCTVCTSPDRKAIDKALAAGEPSRQVAALYRVSEDAMERHRANHLPAALAKAQDAKEAANGDDLLKQVKELQQITRGILAKAYGAGDLPTALKAIHQARGNLELLAKLLGELSEQPIINVTLSPQWVNVRTMLVQALAPYPEARQAVAKALSEVET